VSADRALAERLVRRAGEIALELRGGGADVKAGGATDVVTDADRRAEAELLALLRFERPDDGVLGEEGAAVAGGGRRWLLDPVDGTLNYAAGLPAWCTAVALVDEAGALASAVFDPLHAELFSAARGEGAGLAVAPDVSLVEATVATFVDARRRDDEITLATDALTRRVGALRAVGCGSLELAWVAAGRMHAWVQADVEPWDWHPGALLVGEAGGTVAVHGRWHVAACGPRIVDGLLACIDAGGRTRRGQSP
jgi:myo-inositol-1(or 4)-monophosphatase